MTFGNQGNVVSTTIKTAGSTLAATPSSTIAVGDLLVAICAMDNAGLVDGDTTSVTFSDDKSNVWTRLFETTRTGGGVNDGVTNGMLFCLVTTQIETSDNITMTSANLVNRQFTVEHWTLTGTGITPGGAATARGSSTTPSVTSGSLSNVERLWLGSVGIEGKNSDSFTQDTDGWSDLTATGNSAGSPTGNTAVRGGYKVATQASDTYNPVLGSSRDYATGIAALLETGVPAGQPTQIRTQGVPTGSGSKDRPGKWNSWILKDLLLGMFTKFTTRKKVCSLVN